MDYLIQAKEICKRYASHQALDHVNIDIPHSKIYGLLGPNGAGKTTLIRILNRITAPDTGEILFDGRPFRENDVENIGYLPEERGLYKKMKVGEQAIYLAQLKGLSKKEASLRLKEWFERLQITPWWDKKIEELSKGMAQKVQFITTVIHRPKLLIFDEPFSGFDPINAELLKREILSLRDEGHTIIFSTHNMQSVEEICDEISLINKSRVVLQGDVRKIQEQYKGNVFQIQFEREIEIPSELSNDFEIRSNKINRQGQHILELLNQNHLPSSEIIRRWVHLGEISRFEEVLPTMNDIFINTIKSIDNDTKQN